MLTDVIGRLRAQEHLAEPLLSQRLLVNSELLTKPVSHVGAGMLGASAVPCQPPRTMFEAAHPYRSGDTPCWGEGLAMGQERAR